MNTKFIQRSVAAYVNKLVIATICVFVLFLSNVNAQVNVSGSNGADGNYTTLTAATAAFNKINSNNQAGKNIVIKITADIVAEPGTVALTGATGMWNTLTIIPDGGNRSITGNINSGLIRLDGAKRVTIKNNDAYRLTFSNIYSGGSASTLFFINDACYNVIQNCDFLGSGRNYNTGVICFSTGKGGGSGNDNNTISNCNIREAGGNNPYIGICSVGRDMPGQTNSNNTISDCNIYNFSNVTMNGWHAGIYLDQGNDTWTISGNSIYQTSPYTSGSYICDHYGIRISCLKGNGFKVTGNYIGGTASSCGGSHWTIGSSGTHISSRFRGIYLRVGSADTTFVTKNTVSKVDLYTTLVLTSGTINIDDSASFMGIFGSRGLLNTSENTIGSQTLTDDIIYSAQGPQQAHSMGILYAGLDDWVSNKNVIGGITGKNTGSAYTQIYALELIPKIDGKKWTCRNNTIGGTVANSIQIVSGNGSTPNMVHGIFSGDPNTYKPRYEISNNVVRNLSASSSAGVIGILVVSQYHSGENLIKNNTVYNLSSSVSGKEVYGIYIKWGGGVTIENNSVRSLSSNGSTYGIAAYNNKANCGILVKNNWVKLGYDESGTAITTGTFYGIYEKAESGGEANNFYHNSVYIGGSRPSYAFYNTGTLTPKSNCKNNIFYNGSSNGTSMSIYISGTQDVVANNIYFKSGTDFSAYRNGTTYTNNFSTWKTAASDANSLVSDPLYVNAGANGALFDLHINPASSPALDAGVDLDIANDWDGDFRNDYPEIGADEVCKANVNLAAIPAPHSIGNNDFIFSGVSSSDWDNPGAWYKTAWDATYSIYRTQPAAAIPTSSDNVYIAGTTCWNTYVVNITNSDADCKNLYILAPDAKGTYQLRMSNSRTLNVYGDYMNYGSFDCGNGTVNFTGATNNIVRSNWTNTPTNMFNNVIVNKSTGSITLTGSNATNAIADINGNFTLTSGTWDVGTTTTNYAMYVAGDWTFNGGTFTPRSGKVTLDGSGLQSVGGSNNTSFYDLEINNSSANTQGVNISTTPTITNVLTLTDGKVTTGANRVIVTNTAAAAIVPGAGNTNYANSWIFGNLRRYVTGGGPLNYDIPVGNTSKAFYGKIVSSGFTYTYLDCKFNDPLTTTGGTLDPLLARDFGTPYTSVHSAGEWQIDASGTAGGTYDFYGYTANFSGLTDNTFAILKRPSASTSDADWIGETAGTLNANGGLGRMVAHGYALRKGMSGFSKLGIGIADSPLPVELINFNAECLADAIQINWTTASEINNLSFTLESSSDLNKWETIATIAGAGNSNSILNYKYSDNKQNHVVYYRLKQTDFDGESEIFGPITADCNDITPSIVCYPNPFTDQVVVSLQNIEAEQGSVVLRDVTGRVVLQQNISLPELEQKTILLSLSNLANGVYTLTVYAGEIEKNIRMIKK